MKTRGLTLVLVGLCIATSGRCDVTLTSHGVTYRTYGDSVSCLVTPAGDTTSQLSNQESLARCDELVAVLLARATGGGHRAEFVRDQIFSPPRGTGWVLYAQRHQGYRISGAGARVSRDQKGRISMMGFRYESRELPTFEPRDTTALLKIAERTVPSAITGAPLQTEFMVDPDGKDRPRLIYYVIFPVRFRGRDSSWRVDVDAVTGEVIYSETTFKF